MQPMASSAKYNCLGSLGKIQLSHSLYTAHSGPIMAPDTLHSGGTKGPYSYSKRAAENYPWESPLVEYRQHTWPSVTIF